MTTPTSSAAGGVVVLSPEKILVPALVKLQKDATGRYGNAQIKKAAEDALAQLSDLHGSADGAFSALHVACASKTPKFMVTALDCTEKLIAHGFLGQKNPEVATLVIRVVSACSEQADDAVQLQVVKALLTAVSKGIAHESNLLLTFRACFHIHLVSENAVNRTTSKVSLTQMISWVFAEVEKEKDTFVPPSTSSTPIPATTSSASPPPTSSEPTSKEEEEEMTVPELPLGDTMYPSIQARLGYVESGEGVSPAVAKAAEEAAKEMTKEGETADESKDVVVNTSTGIEGSIIEQHQQEGHGTKQTEEEEYKDAQRKLRFPGPAHKDAFLVLRTLSKLSMKQISFEDISANGEEGKPDPRALKSKLLSLELILQVLEQAGPQLKSSDAILFTIKQYLIPALMKNCMEVNTQVAALAIRVFEQLQLKFKDQLKKEIELVISTVLLGLLESPHASLENRVLVLETLRRMCENVQTMVEIFLNYDCDWNSQDLLKKISETLCKASLTRMSKEGESEKMPEPEAASSKKIRLMGVVALAGLVKSLVGYLTVDDDSNPTSQIAEKTTNDNLEENPQSSSQAATKLASAALDSFQLKQTWKRDLDTAVAKFNQKPKDGIKYLQERGHLDETPQSIAKFLLEQQHLLSKSLIGDYLGDNKDANIQILYAYTDLFDFKDKTIDEAIRIFLSAFRIPGEAQKIDRVMEKFASRFWNCNPDVFPNADTAFVLSYAIIMLQTDAHNPNIKPEKKMKKPDFLRQNRGIAAGRDLSPEYLGGIYDRIVAKPITLKGDDVDSSERGDTATSAPDVNYYDTKGKRKAFFKERAEIMHEVEQIRKGGNASTHQTTATKDEKEAETMSSTFFKVEHSFATSEHVAPMFQVVWKSMLISFTANLLNTEDPDVASVCLEGIYNAIRVAGRFGLEEERDSLIETLASLTKLDSPGELERKNVMCVQAITLLAVSEGNYIGTSWSRVLDCISQLSRLLLMTADGEDDSIVEGRQPPAAATKKRSQPPPPPSDSFKASTALKRVLDYSSIDRVFIRSTFLNEEAIVHFVDALAEVSRSELLLKNSKKPAAAYIHHAKQATASSASTPPVAAPRLRLFSLQKIVEVADFNIDTRPRFTWGRVWQALGEHFVNAGCHSSVQVAMYAVDSLKQLSLKFLNKEEFVGFAFQDRFLRPFESIVKNAKSPDVRALVLHCMQNFIVGKSKSIKSGWGAVFDVIAASALDDSPDNVTLGFSLLELSQQYNSPPYGFSQCALKFASTKNIELAEKCIGFALDYASSAYLQGEEIEGEESRNLLKGIGKYGVTDSREGMRKYALTSVFNVLRNGLEDRADAKVISTLFIQDLLINFDNVAEKREILVGDRWTSSTLSFVIIEMIRFIAQSLFEINYPLVDNSNNVEAEFSKIRKSDDAEPGQFQQKLNSKPTAREQAFLPCLEALLKLFLNLSSQKDRVISLIGVASYNYLLDLLAPRFSVKSWLIVLDSLKQSLENSSPSLINSHDSLKALGLLEELDEDETKVNKVSLDELTSEDFQMPPPANTRIKTSPSGTLQAPGAVAAVNEVTVTENKPAPPPLPDLLLAEIRSLTNLGITKVLCRVLKMPLSDGGKDVFIKACDILEIALKDASAFDDNHPLRIELSRRGFIKAGSEKQPKEGILPPIIPPDALEIEVLAASTLLKYMQVSADEERFQRVLVGLVNRYLRQDKILAAEQTFKPKATGLGNVSVSLVGTTKSESEKELLALTPVVLFALRGMLELEGAPVDRALKWVFPLLLQLIECPNRDVRAIVRAIMEKHLTKRLNL